MVENEAKKVRRRTKKTDTVAPVEPTPNFTMRINLGSTVAPNDGADTTLGAFASSASSSLYSQPSAETTLSQSTPTTSTSSGFTLTMPSMSAPITMPTTTSTIVDSMIPMGTSLGPRGRRHHGRTAISEGTGAISSSDSSDSSDSDGDINDADMVMELRRLKNLQLASNGNTIDSSTAVASSGQNSTFKLNLGTTSGGVSGFNPTSDSGGSGGSGGSSSHVQLSTPTMLQMGGSEIGGDRNFPTSASKEEKYYIAIPQDAPADISQLLDLINSSCVLDYASRRFIEDALLHNFVPSREDIPASAQEKKPEEFYFLIEESPPIFRPDGVIETPSQFFAYNLATKYFRLVKSSRKRRAVRAAGAGGSVDTGNAQPQ